MPDTFKQLLTDVRSCQICADKLPHGVRPVIQAHQNARILIAGQAPGSKVHQTGIPFDDPSGNRLRDWLGVTSEQFYNPELIALLPMGFCYPGTGTSGDLPPRPECAEAWREQLLSYLTSVQLTLVIGQYAMAYHIPVKGSTVTQQVQAWQDHWPQMIPLPHPSPRNNRWLIRNPWFEAELLPELKQRVSDIISG